MCAYHVTSLYIIIYQCCKPAIKAYHFWPQLCEVFCVYPIWSHCAVSVSVLLPANETELAFFKMSDYEKYKANPQTVW